MSTLNVTAIKDASGGDTATINGMTPTASSLQGFRNRVINGDMRIDQRNAGASVSPSGGTVYTLDRWQAGPAGTTSAAISIQQSSTAPTGFVNSLVATITTADATTSAGDRSVIFQPIEGLNVSDLGWGTAGAQTVTLSFWVRSSRTGTFGGAIGNDGLTRSYPFTYTISSANTWEQKTVTIAGDTTGTWLTTNGVGMRVFFGLGVGSTYSGTAGSWASADYRGATGAVVLTETLNATFYITGVQLEAGSVATPFERRPYGTELALCQRYGYGFSNYQLGVTINVTDGYASSLKMPVTMRTTPSLASGATFIPNAGSAGTPALGTTLGRTTTADCVTFYNSASNWSANNLLSVSGFLSAEL